MEYIYLILSGIVIILGIRAELKAQIKKHKRSKYHLWSTEDMK